MADILLIGRRKPSKGWYPKMMQQDRAAEVVLERLGDLENYPDERLTPYEEFEFGGNTYYFTPGGFLYRKDPGSDELGGFFCGYLTDEVWNYRTDDG